MSSKYITLGLQNPKVQYETHNNYAASNHLGIGSACIQQAGTFFVILGHK